jgi:hypothetical protein
LIGKRHPKTRGGCGAGENSLPPRAPQCRIGPEGRHNVEMPPGRVPQHRRRPPERDPPARMPTFVRAGIRCGTRHQGARLSAHRSSRARSSSS